MTSENEMYCMFGIENIIDHITQYRTYFFNSITNNVDQ